MKIKPFETERFLEKPTKKVILLFGHDYGLAHKRARTILESLHKQKPSLEVVSYVAGDLLHKKDEIEAYCLPSLFPKDYAVHVLKAGDQATSFIEELLPQVKQAGVTFILEAEDLGVTSSLRKLSEKSEEIAVIACYAEKKSTLERQIKKRVMHERKTIEPHAIELLVLAFENDVLLLDQELEKLMLYVGDAAHITHADVTRTLGNQGEIKNSFAQSEAIIHQAMVGDFAALEETMSKDAIQAQVLIPVVLTSYLEKLICFHQACAQGKRQEEALLMLKPPLHFLHKDVFLAHATLWPMAKIQALQVKATHMEIALRKDATLAPMLLGQLLYHVAACAKAR